MKKNTKKLSRTKIENSKGRQARLPNTLYKIKYQSTHGKQTCTQGQARGSTEAQGQCIEDTNEKLMEQMTNEKSGRR